MEVEQIKGIIRDNEEEIKTKFKNEKIIDREIKDRNLLKSNLLVITGVRRAGKSVLAHLLFSNKKYGYVNFDDERLFGIKVVELNKILEAFYQLYGKVSNIILDEPQNVEGWELFVNRLQRSKRVVITGSNAKLLSKELATRLTGRYIDIILYPFSFREFLSYKNFSPDVYLTTSIAKTKKFLRNYIEVGGFPEALKIGKRYVLRLYEDIINKDIIARYKVKYLKDLKELARYLISNFSSEITYNKLKNMLSIKSVHTIRNYIDFLETAYLIFKLERFSYKIKEQILAPKKVYVVDSGLANIGFKFSPDFGKLMENLVAIEFMRKKSSDPLIEIYYWKDHQHREVDFIIKRGLKIEKLFQVCYNITDYDTQKREVDALLRAGSEFGCKNLEIITEEYEAQKKIDGKKIKFTPLWKWLLETD